MPTLIFCWYMDVLMCLRFLWLHRGICYSQVFAIPLSHKSEYMPIPERSVQGCIGSIWICRASEEIFWACYSEVQLQVLRLWRLSTRILQATEHTYAPWYGPANLVTWNASISFNFIISLRSSEVKMDTWHVHLFLLNQLLWEPARGERFHNVLPSFQTSGSPLMVFGQPPRTCNQCQPGSVACHWRTFLLKTSGNFWSFFRLWSLGTRIFPVPWVPRWHLSLDNLLVPFVFLEAMHFKVSKIAEKAGFGCTLFETEDVVDDVQVLPAAPTVRRTLRLLHPVLEAAMLVVQGSKLRRCDAVNGRSWSNQINDDSNIPKRI